MLVIAGCVYTAIGLSWLIASSPGREAGISWLPWQAVNSTAVGWMWVASGVLAFVAGLFSKGHRRWENVAYFGAVFVPILLAIWFAIAWWAGSAPNGLLTTISYTGYAALVGWVGARVRDEPGVIVP